MGKEENIVQRVVELIESTTNARQSLERKFQKYYRMFNGELDTSSEYPWRSRLYMKETYKVIDTIHPIFMDMLFAKGNAFRIKPLKEIDKKQGTAIEALIDYYIEKMDAYEQFEDFTKEMLITGTAFGKMSWELEKKEYEGTEIIDVPNMKDIPLLGPTQIGTKKKSVKKTKIKIVKDNPVFQHVSYKDIFVSTRATSLKDTWVIHRSWKTIRELEEENMMMENAIGKVKYKNLSKLREIDGGINIEATRQDEITREEKRELGINPGYPAAEKQDIDVTETKLEKNEEDEIEILEYWDKSGKNVYIIAGRQVLLRERKNPFQHGGKPFLYSNYVRRPKELWGIGICELAEDGQDFLNTSVNQAVDSNSLANNLMVIASREANVDPDQVRTRPGGVIYVDTDPNEPVSAKLREIKFSKVDVSPEIGLAKSEIQEVTGATEIVQGTFQSGAVRNTSQTRLLQSTANRKFLGKILTYDNMFLTKFIEMDYSLIQQYMTRDEVVEIIGEEGAEYRTVGPADIVDDAQFIAVGTKQLADMEAIVHQMENFMSIASNIPLAEQLVNFRYILRKLWDNISSENDGDQVVASEEQADEMARRMAAAAQSQSTVNQGGQAETVGGVNPSQPNLAGGAAQQNG